MGCCGEKSMEKIEIKEQQKKEIELLKHEEEEQQKNKEEIERLKQEEEKKKKNMLFNINMYRGDTWSKYEIWEKNFMTTSEIENYLKESKAKENYEDIYYLFLLYSWIERKIKYDEKAENKQECESVDNIILKKKTNSFGFATLFKSIGEKIGFNIELVKGFNKHLILELTEF